MAKIDRPAKAGKCTETSSLFAEGDDMAIGILDELPLVAVRDADGAAVVQLTPDHAARAAASLMVAAMACTPIDQRKSLQDIFTARMLALSTIEGAKATIAAYAARRPS